MQISAQSKYFVGTYTQPLGTSYQAYPIGVCVNFEITLSGFTPVNQYGVYSCNNAGDTVTFTDYGTDATCSGTVESTTDYQSGVTAGNEGSFNCQGEDNYVITDGCTVNTGSSIDCCTAACLGSIESTNVCVNNGDGTYKMYVYFQ